MLDYFMPWVAASESLCADSGLMSNTLNPYRGYKDILHQLSIVLINPKRRAEAYTAYHVLTMDTCDSLTDFLADYMEPATEANIHAS